MGSAVLCPGAEFYGIWINSGEYCLNVASEAIFHNLLVEMSGTLLFELKILVGYAHKFLMQLQIRPRLR
jgi:hypothetical protein